MRAASPVRYRIADEDLRLSQQDMGVDPVDADLLAVELLSDAGFAPHGSLVTTC